MENTSTKKKSEFMEYLAAISIGLAILCGGAAYLFYGKWKEAEKQSPLMPGQSTVMEQREKAVNYNLKKELELTTEQLNSITDTNTIQIKLKGSEYSPTSKAVLYFNRSKLEVNLRIHQLPPLPEGKKYQLWYGTTDGKSKSAGVFNLDSPVHPFKNITDAEAFMVTMEKEEGAAQANMNAIHLKSF